MRLTELECRFISREIWLENGKKSEHWITVDAIEDAHGIAMLCPKCFVDPPVGPVGCHSIVCWRPFVPSHVDPKPGRWELVGTSIDDLTLKAGSSSILLQGGCNAHFFVRAGSIVGC